MHCVGIVTIMFGRIYVHCKTKFSLSVPLTNKIDKVVHISLWAYPI